MTNHVHDHLVLSPMILDRPYTRACARKLAEAAAAAAAVALDAQTAPVLAVAAGPAKRVRRKPRTTAAAAAATDRPAASRRRGKGPVIGVEAITDAPPAPSRRTAAGTRRQRTPPLGERAASAASTAPSSAASSRSSSRSSTPTVGHATVAAPAASRPASAAGSLASTVSAESASVGGVTPVAAVAAEHGPSRLVTAPAATRVLADTRPRASSDSELPHTPEARRMPAVPPYPPPLRRVAAESRWVAGADGPSTPRVARDMGAMRYRLSLLEQDPSSPSHHKRRRRSLGDDASVYESILKDELLPPTPTDTTRRALFMGGTPRRRSALALAPPPPPPLTPASSSSDPPAPAEVVPAVPPSPSAFTFPATGAVTNPLQAMQALARPAARRSSLVTALFENPFHSTCPLSRAGREMIMQPRTERRVVPALPYKVLDAPDLADDFYLNLLDWGQQNILAVGLGSCVYLWNADTASVSKLCDLAPADSVTAVQWNPRGNMLSIGTHRGKLQQWDVVKQSLVCTTDAHTARLGAIHWTHGAVTTGSRDRTVAHWDMRRPSDTPLARLQAHRQEVCGLRWSPDGTALASGGNDNKLYLYDARKLADPMIKYTEHTAAVKALAWSPHQAGLLASGGGTADRHIRFWNTHAASTAAVLAVDTQSQVCNLAWSPTTDELVSTHGYSQHQVVVWSCASMTPVATLTGHSQRVLYLSVAPDGQSICTGAGDETLRFWNVFPPAPATAAAKQGVGMHTPWAQLR
ncbi:Fizzy- protein [Allomyces arbusculus]|nr:Fizzy- protein [Allomyces arbusculus]